MESRTVAFLKTMIAVAWADGRVVPAERGMLDALISAADVSDAEREALTVFASSPRTLDDAPLDALDEETKRSVLDRAVVLALIDGEVQVGEHALLLDLGRRLGIANVPEVLAAAEIKARQLRELL